MPLSKKKNSIFHSKHTEAFWGYAFLAPNLIATVVFLFIPIVYSLYLSFHQWDMINKPEFIGLQNFINRMPQDEQFWISLINTAVYSLISIPLGVFIALLIAWFLSGNLKGTGFFRTIIFIPVTLSMVAVSMVWRWLLNGDYGIINYFLHSMGLETINFLGDEKYAMISIVLIGIWKSLGFNMVILISAFKEVPVSLYEAAEIDGASNLKKFQKISMPLIHPSLFFVTIMSIINSFQVFDIIYTTTQGGPGTATQVIYYLIWQNAFKFFDMGYASALSWVVFLVVFILTMLQMHFSNKRMNIFE